MMLFLNCLDQPSYDTFLRMLDSFAIGDGWIQAHNLIIHRFLDSNPHLFNVIESKSPEGHQVLTIESALYAERNESEYT